MPMPTAWLDRIFDKLTITYGSAFMDRWRGIDPLSVKADWLDQLDGMEQHNGQMIAYGLANLPEKPPTVVEFRNICRRAPIADSPRLEAPRLPPDRIKAELSKLGPVREAVLQTAGSVDPKGWAKCLHARHRAGEKLRPMQLRFAREALGADWEAA